MRRSEALAIAASLSLGLLVAIAIHQGTRRASEAEPEAPVANAVARMSVFQRPRRSTDLLPRSLAKNLPELNATSADRRFRPGAIGLTGARRVLVRGRQSPVDVFVVPTDTGQACFAVPDGPGGCVARFDAGAPVTYVLYDPDSTGSGARPFVLGLVPDAARRVEVVVGGSRRRAQMGENAFVYEVARPTDRPTAIVVYDASGRQVRTTVPASR